MGDAQGNGPEPLFPERVGDYERFLSISREIRANRVRRTVSPEQCEMFVRLDARIVGGTMSSGGRLPGIHGTGWRGSLR